MAVARVLVSVLIPLSGVFAAVQQDSAASAANPIRKVVTMLQAMQKKVTAEGVKEKELYDKFACYCRNGAGELSKSISEAETKAPVLTSDITESESKKKQLEEDLKAHQADREAAKSAMTTATALREKAAADFAKDNSTYTSNIAALGNAIAAISKGMTGAFLQTGEAQVLKKLVLSQANLLEADRQDIMAFLSGEQEGQYVPQSGDIVGILKGIKDEMSKSLSEASTAEAAAISAHDELMAAKTKELDANTKAIEAKSVRVGQLAVDIQTMNNDLADTESGLSEDKKFLADMDKNCAAQAKEWDERSKTRSEEILAIADTIKVLNDDDALELFKKSLPGSSSSFVQMAASKVSTRQRALSIIRAARRSSSHRPQFDFITLAIQGKAVGFEKVIKMIDNMISTLKAEQKDDDDKKSYCDKQFDISGDKKKGLAKATSDIDISIQEATEGVATLKEEIEALEDKIKDLDKSVTEATDNRKSEHEDFTQMMASDSAAKELLKFAINRLNKFYNPSLVKETAATGDDAASGAPVLAEVSTHGAPPVPSGAYAKKKDDSDSVIGMINVLMKSLDKEIAEAQTAEKEAQKDYEEMLKDSADKRALDSKALTDKNIAKANLEEDIESSKETKASTAKEMMATDKFISSLHADCDFLLQYFDVRSEARSSEVDALKNAKAVLNGVDMPEISLLEKQQVNKNNLRRR